MKKQLIYSLILSLGIAGSSCSNLLDTTTYGQQTSETFYKTDTQIGEALTGAYLQLRVKWNEYALDHYLIGDCTTDDALKGGGSEGDMAEMYDMEQFITQPSNAEVARRWRLLYGLVNRANDVIYYAPSAQGDTELLKRYVNEAKALRAFGYYFLVTSFGDVPLITEPTTPDAVTITERTPKERIYELIIQDLTDAKNLPAKGEYSIDEQYRVTSGMARAMLAKTYMFTFNYVEAEKVLKEIVDSRKYELLPQYSYNWFKEYENSSESVFEIPNQMYNKNVGTGTNVPHFFTSRGAVAGYGGYGFHCPSQDLWDAYDADDPRLTYVFTHTGDRYAGDTQEQNNSVSPTGYHDYKMTVPAVDKIGWDVWLISYNIRFIRYADILLLYAEALNELEDGSSYDISSWDGSTTYSVSRDINEMKKGIRQVRRRAGVPDYTMSEYQDRDVFRKKLKRERQIELMAEGQRYFDLRRWKDAEVEESKKNYGCNFYMSDTEEQREQFYTPIEIADLPTAFSRKLYFWPISHDELKRNKRLTQNPGWTYND